jgi:hypothetical protein
MYAKATVPIMNAAFSLPFLEVSWWLPHAPVATGISK